jgi:tRNA pseudouridine13 synthase
VPRSGWRPPPTERAIGLGFYASSTPPVPGRLKADAADFVVEEISSYPAPAPGGPYTVLRVRSRDWEQHELAGQLARALGLPPNAVRWAGTKDRRAVSDRLFSYRGPPPTGPLPLPGVELLEAYEAQEGLQLGHHFGNRFAIRVSGLTRPVAEVRSAFAATRAELTTIGGFPNFFGPQRFGEARPVTHLVGRALVRGDPAAAVETYLTFVEPGSNSLGDAARLEYAHDHDPTRALRTFPPAFRFERILLDHLARGHSPERALRALSHELRTLFIHAYQSFLFNRWLTERWARDLALDRPEPGDHLVRFRPDGTTRGDAAIPVTLDNLGEARDLTTRGQALLAAPLIGYATPLGSGVPEEMLRALLAEEQIVPGDFRLPRTPDVASAGSWRPAQVALPPIELVLPMAAEPTEAGSIECRFALGKGCYATVLLREFLKAGAEDGASISKQRF